MPEGPRGRPSSPWPPRGPRPLLARLARRTAAGLASARRAAHPDASAGGLRAPGVARGRMAAHSRFAGCPARRRGGRDPGGGACLCRRDRGRPGGPRGLARDGGVGGGRRGRVRPRTVPCRLDGRRARGRRPRARPCRGRPSLRRRAPTGRGRRRARTGARRRSGGGRRPRRPPGGPSPPMRPAGAPVPRRSPPGPAAARARGSPRPARRAWARAASRPRGARRRRGARGGRRARARRALARAPLPASCATPLPGGGSGRGWRRRVGPGSQAHPAGRGRALARPATARGPYGKASRIASPVSGASAAAAVGLA